MINIHEIEPKALGDAPLQTVTIVYHRVEELNLMHRTTGTYTTTFTHTAGSYTLWPMFYNPENQYPRGREVLELPVTLESGGSGGIYTHTKPLEQAVRSPIRTARILETAAAAQSATYVEMVKNAQGLLADTTTDGRITHESSIHQGPLGLLHDATTAIGLYGWLIIVFCFASIAFGWTQRRKRAMRQRRLPYLEEKSKGSRLN
jgi:hypothetical protein